MVTKLKIRRDTSAVWNLINPTLEQGEPAVELDTGKMKIGDGERPYVELPYTSSTTEGTPTIAWGDITGTIASNGALATALSNKEAKANKGNANGYAPLNEDAEIPLVHYLPALLKGKANGMAELDENKLIPKINLPAITVPDSIPKGVIVMWSGTIATIPAGWTLCDGTNGTPNLLGRFVFGAENAGATGGSNYLTLTAANIPSHTHTTGSHTHTFSGTTSSTAHGHGIATTTGGVNQPSFAMPLSGVTSVATTTTYGLYSAIPPTSGSHSHSFSGTTEAASGTTGSTGTGTAIDNRPAFYALAFIMKL